MNTVVDTIIRDMKSTKLLEQFQIRFCVEYLRDGKPVQAAIRAGAKESEAEAIASQLIVKTSTYQYIETINAYLRYERDPRYRNAPRPSLDNIYYCCSQKTGSQWLKKIFLDPAFYHATGLMMFPYVARGNKYATCFSEPLPRDTIATHLYVSYHTYASIPKPKRYKTFYILRDPRDVVVSWYYSAKYSHALIEPVPRLRERLIELEFEEGMIFIIDELLDWRFFDCQRSWMEEGQTDPAVQIFRYEDMAKDEAGFLQMLFEYLDIKMGHRQLDELHQRHGFENYSNGRKKGIEDQRSHMRSGISGDWKHKFNEQIKTYFYDKTGNLVESLGYVR